ncbi:MAG: putative toxin-antitoxin system toxin component, PIN family [Actinomycetota bacterium]
MIRAVLHPGVLIAGLISPSGVPASIIRAWQQGIFELVVSEKLLDELTATLLRPKFRRWVDGDDAVTFVEVLRLAAMVVDDPADVERVSRGPNDDYLVALASAAHASVLVSGDRDLTSIERSDPPIVSPRRFLEPLGSR